MGNTIKHTFAKCRNGREQLLAKEGAPSPPPEQQQKKTGQAPETTVFGRGVRRVSDYSVYDVADAEEDDGPTPGLEDVDVGMPAEDRGAGAGGGAGEEVWGEGFPPPAEAEDVERKKGVLGTPVNACSGGGACTGASSTPARRADTGCTAEQFFQSSPELGEGEHQPPSGELSFDFADRGGEGHVDHKLVGAAYRSCSGTAESRRREAEREAERNFDKILKQGGQAKPAKNENHRPNSDDSRSSSSDSSSDSEDSHSDSSSDSDDDRGVSKTTTGSCSTGSKTTAATASTPREVATTSSPHQSEPPPPPPPPSSDDRMVEKQQALTRPPAASGVTGSRLEPPGGGGAATNQPLNRVGSISPTPSSGSRSPRSFQGIFDDVAPSAMRAAIYRYRDARKYQDVYPSMNSVSSRGRSLLMQAIVDREWDIAKYLILLQPQEVDESYSHNDLHQTTSTEQPGQETNFQLIDHRCGRTGCTCLTLSLELGQFELAKLVLRHRKFLKVSGKTQFGQDAVSLALAKNARSRPLVSTYIRFYRYL